MVESIFENVLTASYKETRVRMLCAAVVVTVPILGISTQWKRVPGMSETKYLPVPS